jgi:hypothetical protein
VKSATLELLKYFEREGIQCLGNPYIERAEDVADGPAIVHCQSNLFGLLTLVRVTTIGGRWLAQWWGRPEEAATLDPYAIVAVLGGVRTCNIADA